MYFGSAMKIILRKNKIKLSTAIPMVRYGIVLYGFMTVLSSCTTLQEHNVNDNDNSKYNAHSLAKDWREQVRKNPYNPYESSAYPNDNDSEYYYPAKKPKKKYSSNPKNNVDNDSDSSYGRFPRYNPDDDNLYLDPKQYPLYLDYGG